MNERFRLVVIYSLVMLGVLYLIPQPVSANEDGIGWTTFRGPVGTGVVPASCDSLPLHWSETENVTWKTAIPHRGLSTPVILNGKMWLTTATLEGHDFFVLCVDAKTGEILLNKKLFHADEPEPLGNNVNSYASPSPVIEPGRVYISFGSYGTACLDTKTYEVLWSHSKLPCRHYRGPGSSPILYQDLLILTMDGVDQQYVVALNKNTGETVWKTERSADYDDLDANGEPKRNGDFRKAFSTPLVIEASGKSQLISAGAKAAYAYNPLTGGELWRWQHKDHSSSASLLFGDGLSYILTGFSRAELVAIKVDGQGLLTDDSIVWRTKKSMPRTPSPLLVDNLIYTLADSGHVTCLEAQTGKTLWSERLKGKFAASLLYANKRIYCVDQTGQTTILQAGPTYKTLATNQLDEGCMASPVTVDHALFLRTDKHLYRIDE